MNTDRASLAHLRHELRTPLNHIIGYSELLLEDVETGDRGAFAPHVRRILEDARRLLDVVNDYLAPAKTGAETTGRIQLPAELFAPLDQIIVSGARLRQLAVEAGADALLADLDRISAAAARLAELVRDTVVPSQVKGAEAKAVKDAIGVEARAQARVVEPGAILVVDDDEKNREVLSRRLAREGHTNVVTAANGHQALALLRERQFDLVLLDIEMPELNGFEVLEHLKADERLRHLPVIMISAMDEMDSVIRCIELGAEDFLPKPFNPTLLRARVGASLEKKRLRDEIIAHRDRMEQELRSAREIQLSMVPTEFPVADASQPVELFATLQPARQIGGDFYDFFWRDADTFCLVVADVSDKGAPAALFMARTKSLIRLVATLLGPTHGGAPAPHEIVAKVSEELYRDNPHSMFVTLFFGMLDPARGSLKYCNAGHNAPYVVSVRDGVVPLCGAKGKPLGILESSAYSSAGHELAHGDCIFVFTDGITEAMDGSAAFFSESRLEEALRPLAGSAPRVIVDGVLERVRDFTRDAPQSDDIAAMAVRLAE